MVTPTALKCPNCAAQIQMDYFDPERGTALCSYCRTVITLPGRAREAPMLKRLAVPLPQGMTIEEGVSGTLITRKWFNVVILFLVFFCIAWDAFLFFWYGIALSTDAPWIMSVFPLAHVAVGIGLTYSTLAGLVNKTWIKAYNGVVSVIHGPVPWRGNLVIPCAEIDQLYCKEKVSHGKNGPRVSYEVWALKQDGATLKLLGGSLTDDQAIFIEQQLEKSMGLTDRRVAGEMTRL